MKTIIKQGNNCSNVVLSNCNLILPTAYIERQNISVSSPNHLNGSVTTVQKSDVVSPVLTSMSHTGNSVVPSINFDKVILSPPTTSLVKTEKEDSSELLFPIQQNNVTTFNPELFAENSKPFTYETLNNFSTLDTVVRFNPGVLSLCVNVPNEVSVNSVSRPSDSYNNEEFLEPIITGLGHSVVSTGLQSGAYVSMYPFSQSSGTPIYGSDFQSALFSSDEFIKIKEEPQDFVENNIEESNNVEMASNKPPSFEPIIVAISSLKENGERIDMQNTENNNKKLNASENDTDEDYQYLMSMLPKLRQLPKDLKRKFKRDVQNRLTSAIFQANKRKRKKASGTGQL